MASIFGVAGVSSVTRNTADAGQMQLRTDRSGALATVDWMTALALEGRVFGVNVGTGTAPTTFNAAYSAGEQDFYLYVPAGKVVIPLYIGIQMEDSGTALVQDILAAVSDNGDSSVTGTALTVYNLRSDAPFSSACTATAVVTSGGTTHLAGNRVEFWRPTAGFAEDGFNGSTAWVNNKMHGMEWSARTSIPPVIAPLGALSIYVGAQAGTGFIEVIYAELPSNAIV